MGNATSISSRASGAPRQMNAASEQTRIGRPADVKRIGVAETLGIAIGGAQQQPDPLALPQRDALVFDVLQGVAGEQMKRRVEAQQFLDERGARRRRREPATGSAGLQQGFHAVAERVNGRLVAGFRTRMQVAISSSSVRRPSSVWR